jgi:epoxide hydrolase-like predicted phosphatase
MAIEAVLFDFGGVLVSSPFDAMAAAGPGALELFVGDYAVDGDHPWHRLERGEISLAVYWEDLQQRAAAAGVEIDAAKLAGFYGRLEVHDEVVERVRTLRAEGLRTALVTNNVREAGETWRSRVPLDELFDAVVDSCELGMRKPNPRIYLHALELLGGVEPSAAVMLDDAPGNVAGAEAAGLIGILVGPDPAVALAELDALLARAA